jgi:hypothetical protein
MGPSKQRRVWLAIASASLLPGAAGCFAPIVSVSDRSALEQQLTSAALRRSVAKLDLAALDRNATYALELATPEGGDTALIRARITERLANEGVRVASGAGDAADPAAAPTLRAVVPFSGVDLESTLLGLPFVVPGLPVALGDISIYRSSQLTGRARVELSLREAEDPSLVFSAASEASRYYRNFTFLTFVGPFRWTNLDEGYPGEEEGTFWSFSADPDD